MTVTSGFFNALNSDRRYDALQMGRLFDGLINDGVYETIYKQFRVSPKEGFQIQVNTGRGWFEHTWIWNDSVLLLNLREPNPIRNRIDAVVIEVNHDVDVRADSIKIIEGTPSDSPVRPTLKKGEGEVYQFPLAYISVKSNAQEITASDITNMVGTSSTPFVTGVVSVMDIDMLTAQWEAQWDDKLEDHDKDWIKRLEDYKKKWEVWYTEHTTQYNYNFNDWFSQLRALLEDDVAANMAAEILDLKNKFNMLIGDHMLVASIDDDKDDPILDNEGREIEGTSYFCDRDCCIEQSNRPNMSDSSIIEPIF